MKIGMTVKEAYQVARDRWGSGAYAFELTEYKTGRVACHVGRNSHVLEVVAVDLEEKSLTISPTDKVDPNGFSMTMGTGETFEEAFESADAIERAIA